MPPGVAGELAGVPPLDGVLLTGPDALSAAADDFGHSVHRPPVAVLRPGSADDVAAIVRDANDHGVQVACRGRGHATAGQAQAPGGIVVDSGPLSAIHEIGPAGAVVDAGVTWRALIEATPRYHTPAAAPDDDALLAGLRDTRAAVRAEDVPYAAFLARIDPIVEFQVQAGVWGFPHPWFDVFVPGAAVDAYAGPIEAARGAGGLRYCIGSVPFTTEDWRHHFGPHWPAFERAKRTYDPANVLAPGQGIFPR